MPWHELYRRWSAFGPMVVVRQSYSLPGTVVS